MESKFPFILQKNALIFFPFADSGIGAGIDSYYEYCLKAYILLGDKSYLEKFNRVSISCVCLGIWKILVYRENHRNLHLFTFGCTEPACKQSN